MPESVDRRQRPHMLRVWLSNEEWDALQKGAEARGWNRSQFLRELVRTQLLVPAAGAQP